CREHDCGNALFYAAAKNSAIIFDTQLFTNKSGADGSLDTASPCCDIPLPPHLVTRTMVVLKDLNGDRMAELVRDAAVKDATEILERLGTSAKGLSGEEAAERLEVFGPNEVAQERHHTWLQRFYHATVNPLVILLTLLAIVSFATGDFRAGSVMILMVALGLSLRFIQETKADNAAARLKAMISVTATVVRNGETREITLRELVPGDIVKLSSGDMIPGDARLISAKDLFVIQATLTGESLPVEKNDAPDARDTVSTIER